MLSTKSWGRLPVAVFTLSLLAIGGAGLPAATAVAVPVATSSRAAAPSRAATPASTATPASAARPAAVLPATAPQSSGTDYWVTFQRNASSTGTSTLFLTGATATTGTVNWGGTAVSFTVTPGQVTTVTAPSAYNSSVYLEGQEVASARLGVHITAADPITVYGLEYSASSSDAFLGIPTPGLGTRYRAVSAPQTSTSSNAGRSRILVVATADNTTVEITPSETFGSRTAGVPYDVTLNAGWVYTLGSNSNASGSNNVTGTLITSDNPVAVIAGVDTASQPVGLNTTDQQSQELAPTTEWGTDFLASRFDSVSAGTPLTIVADTDGTNVTLDGGSPIALNAGDSYSTTVANSGDTAVVIASDNPVEVEQYMVNNSYDPGGSVEPVTGDPSAMLLPPITQWLSSYTFATPGTGFVFNAVNVVVPQADTHAVSLDGTPIDSDDFTDIPNTTDAVAQELLSAGTHTISAADPFGIYVYGANAANSYAYPGGSGFSTGAPELTPQTITFTGPGDTALAAGTVTVSATSDSGLDVTFSSTTPSVCTVSGTTVTLVDHGTCTIDADQAGDETYAPATTVEQSFTVTEPQTIDFPQPATVDLADGTATLSATALGGDVSFTSSTPSVCTVSGTTVTLLTAGTCTVAADQAGADGIDAAPTVTRSFTVLADQTITFTGPADTDLATGTVALSASAPGGAVTFTSTTPAVCTVSDTTVTLVSPGTCSIAADQAGDGTTAAAPTVTRSFTVLADQTIDFPQPAAADLADGTATLSATAPGGDVTFTSSTPSVCTVTGTTVTLVTAGTCTIAADQSGDGSTAAAPTVTRSFQIKAEQAIDFTAPAPDVPLANATVDLTATAPGGDVTFTTSTPDICTVGGGTVTLLAHGTCTVTAHQSGDDTHLAAPPVTRSFTVTEPQTISFQQPADVALSTGTVDLNATAPGGDVTFTASTPDVCTVSGTTVTLVGTGTCTVTADQSGGDGILPAASVTRSFQVQTGQTITFAQPAQVALGSGPVTLTASASSGLPITFTSATPAVCTVSGSTVTLLTAGTCTIAADDAGSATYLAAPTAMRSFVVTPAPAPPTVVTSPTDVSVQPGATATFIASASGYPTPTVQWQVLAPGGRWTTIPGATGPTYTTGPLSSAQNGTQYRAVFTNVNGSVASDPATTTVSAPPAPTPLVLVSQNLWGHIEIAAHSTRIPFTIRLNQSRPALSVVLTDNRTHRVLASTTVQPARAGTSFSGAIAFGLGAIHGYGSYTWTLTTHGGGPEQAFVLNTDLRQHSTLVLHTQRKGAQVTLTGAARVFNVGARSYRPWANRVVLIQEETRNGWVTIGRTRTNGRGLINARLHLPGHLTLRVFDQDTANQWGRTSNTRAV